MSDCTFGQGKSVIDGILLGVYNDGKTEDLRFKLVDSNSDDRLDRTTFESTFCLR